jgi:hypothetical protein
MSLPPVPKPRPSLGRRIAGIAAVAVAATLWLVVYLLHRSPDFYEQELARPVEAQQAASDEFLTNVTATVSQAQRPGAWRTEFTEDQINGWLAFDLPRNHPDLLGETSHAPRVELDENIGRVAFEYRGIVNTIVCLELSAEVRDPRTVAIRLQSLSGGAVPLPLGAVVDEVTTTAAQLEHEVRWIEEKGRPVALITVPALEENGQEISLAEVRLEPGRIVLLGETRAKPKP